MIAPAFTLAPRLAPAARIDLKVSRRLARALNAQDGRCWRNALRAWEHHLPDATYVEGYVVSNDTGLLPMEHAWIEQPDGRVVDPTPAFCGSGSHETAYVPAFRYTPDHLRYLFTRCAAMPLPLSRIGMADFSAFHHLDWQAATVTVWQHAEARHLGRHGVSLFRCDEATMLNALGIPSVAASHPDSSRWHPPLLTKLRLERERSGRQLLTLVTGSEERPGTSPHT